MFENKALTMQKSLFRSFLWSILASLKRIPLILNYIHFDCSIQLQNLVSGNPPKMLRCPYFMEEGGGLEGYQNFPICIRRAPRAERPCLHGPTHSLNPTQ